MANNSISSKWWLGHLLVALLERKRNVDENEKRKRLDARDNEWIGWFAWHHIFHIELFYLLEESFVFGTVEHDAVGYVAADAEYPDASAYWDRLLAFIVNTAKEICTLEN